MVSWLGPRRFSGGRACSASSSLMDWARKKGGREPLSVGLREVLFCNVCALLGQLIKGTSFSVMLNSVRSA